jgi:hypothetical protein
MRHYVPKGIVDSPIKLLLGDIFQNEKLSNKKADDFSGWLLYIMPVLFAGVFWTMRHFFMTIIFACHT